MVLMEGWQAMQTMLWVQRPAEGDDATKFVGDVARSGINAPMLWCSSRSRHILQRRFGAVARTQRPYNYIVMQSLPQDYRLEVLQDSHAVEHLERGPMQQRQRHKVANLHTSVALPTPSR